MHAAENDMVFKVLNIDRIPKFNSPVFLENKTPFGIIDEIFGPINEVVCL
jgi:H/ACA ribonucleoprotein complex subunit 1